MDSVNFSKNITFASSYNIHFIVMINRVLIRIRVVQVLYSSYLSENKELKKAEAELLLSLQKSYDLYFYFLLLIVEITELYAKRVEQRKTKMLPTQEDLNPNMKLITNKFIVQLQQNKELFDYLTEHPLSWHQHEAFIRNLLDKILDSDIYKKYLIDENSDYNTDREFWRKVFKQFICSNEELEEILEEESVYWNDDVEIIQSFVLKTIKKFDENNGENQALLPMFKDDEDSKFAQKLLRESMLNVKVFRDMISKYAKNWESDRIAFMDLIIMQIAMAELLSFPSIPINVTLNEYIDIAKSYSTNKSAPFINGILDSIVKELRADKKLLKK